VKKRPLLTGLLVFGVLALIFFLWVYGTTIFTESPVLSDDRIALIRIEGVILDSKDTIDELKRYRENPAIKAILLRIDSPGGAVVPSQEIYEEVKKARVEGKKKVVSSMGTLAASGGYYIASASDKIVANPGTLTGSIGVIMELANVEGLMKKIGVESVVIKSGAHKDMVSPFRKMRKEEQQILQNVLNDVHEQFIEAVSEGRGMPIQKVRSLADGRIFTGRQAKQIGLVDELGDLQDAIRITASLVGIKGEPKVVETKKRFSFFDLFRDQFGGKWGFFPRMPGAIQLKYLLTLE
jgi:protease IV